MKKAVLISCFDWYNTRLRPIRELLIQKGYEVAVLEMDFHHINKEPIEVRYRECTYISVPEYKNNISISRLRSHLVFGKKVNQWIQENNPELICCQVPPNNVAKYCMQYKQSHPDTRFILDIIDLWPESMPLGKLKSTLPAKMWRNWRDKAITSADHVFTECDLYQEKLKNVLNPDKTSTLYLYKEQTDKEKEFVKKFIDEREQHVDDHIIRFAYLGSMNNIIDIEGICEVIQQFQNQGYFCELHAVGDGESRDRFEEAVRETGCQTHFYGPAFDEIEKIKILAPCDYAFNMMKGDISVGLTIKSIDYLSYGLPLINNIRGDTWKMVEDLRIGINVDNDAEIRNVDHNRVVRVFNERFTKEPSFITKINGVII